jgi:hypothetical protein
VKENSEQQRTRDKRLLIYSAIFGNGETRGQVVGRVGGGALGFRAPPLSAAVLLNLGPNRRLASLNNRKLR